MTDPPSRIPLSVYMHGADFRSSRGPPASETSTSSTAPPPPSVPAPVSIPTASARVPPPGPITCDNSDGKDDGEFAETVVYLREDSKKLSFPQKDKTGNNAPVTVMAIIVRRKTRPPKVYLCTRDVGDCLGYSPPKAAIQCAIKAETISAGKMTLFAPPHTIWAKREKAARRNKKVETPGATASGEYGRKMYYVDGVAIKQMLEHADRKGNKGQIVDWLSRLGIVEIGPEWRKTAFDFATFLTDYVPREEAKEVVYCRAIECACSRRRGCGGLIKQHKVGAYKVDMVYADAGLAIECDENGHRDRSLGAEAARQAAVLKEFRAMYRFDPDAAGIDEHTVASDVLLVLSEVARNGNDFRAAAGLVIAGILFVADSPSSASALQSSTAAAPAACTSLGSATKPPK